MQCLHKEESFQECPSTWEIILQHCPENEVEEVKILLGTSLIEQSIDLHNEVNTFLEIWQQMRDDVRLVKETPLHSSHLAEPPYVRERLIQEIKFFISHLKKKTLADSGSGGTQLRPHIINYVACADEAELKGVGLIGSSASGSRPHSTTSSRDTPLRSGSSGQLDGSDCNNDLESFSKNINAAEVEKIVKNLRHLLEKECDHCHSNIQFLQQCIEDEQNGLEEQPIPTLKELRDFGSQLEKDYLAEKLPDVTCSITTPTPLPPAIPKPHQQGVGLNRASKVRHNSGHRPISPSIILPSIASGYAQPP